jgi:hypothetical protein
MILHKSLTLERKTCNIRQLCSSDYWKKYFYRSRLKTLQFPADEVLSNVIDF